MKPEILEHQIAHASYLTVERLRMRLTDCRDAVLGPAGFWPDHDAQGGRLAEARREAFRSDH